MLAGCAATPASVPSAPVASSAPAGSPPASPSGSPVAPFPTSGPSSAGCTQPTPTDVSAFALGERRVVESVRLSVADGRITLSDRQRSAVGRPELAGPDGTTVSGGDLLRQTANLLTTTRSVRLVLAPLAGPEQGLAAGRPPYDIPGRHVAYTSVRALTATITLTCDRTVERRRLTGDVDAAVGQVSCSGSSSEAARPAGTTAAEVYRERC